MKKEFHLFPDIRLVCGETSDMSRENAVEISCCVRGVCEYNIGHEYFYLTPDNCIALKYDAERECHFSHSSDNCCISLLIGLQSEHLEHSELFEIPDIVRNIEKHGVSAYLINDSIKTLISDLYYYCLASNVSMIRVKVLELLILLGNCRISFSGSRCKIENVGRYLCQNEYEHVTISQLSDSFKINPTTLKNEFKQYYGSTIYAYTKYRKMFLAAGLMKNTELKVMDIAEKVGYSNPSKFSSAFRSVIGIPPRRYRESFQMEHRAYNGAVITEKQPKIAY